MLYVYSFPYYTRSTHTIVETLDVYWHQSKISIQVVWFDENRPITDYLKNSNILYADYKSCQYYIISATKLEPPVLIKLENEIKNFELEITYRKSNKIPFATIAEYDEPSVAALVNEAPLCIHYSNFYDKDLNVEIINTTSDDESHYNDNDYILRLYQFVNRFSFVRHLKSVNRSNVIRYKLFDTKHPIPTTQIHYTLPTFCDVYNSKLASFERTGLIYWIITSHQFYPITTLKKPSHNIVDFNTFPKEAIDDIITVFHEFDFYNIDMTDNCMSSTDSENNIMFVGIMEESTVQELAETTFLSDQMYVNDDDD